MLYLKSPIQIGIITKRNNWDIETILLALVIANFHLQKQINEIESMAHSSQQGLTTTQKQLREHLMNPH